MEQQLSLNHVSNRLYYGAPKHALPEYLQERLRDFFAKAESSFKEESKRGTTPNWLINIQPETRPSIGRGAAYEWVVLAVDDPCEGAPDRSFYPEEYGYYDGRVEYKVSVLTRDNRTTDYSTATRLLSFLQRDEHLFAQEAGEELGRMASYSIERRMRYL